jgi:hypothetical protein
VICRARWIILNERLTIALARPAYQAAYQYGESCIPSLRDALLKNEQDVHLFEAGVSEPAV